MKPLALLDLFSGIGGFSLGLERSGFFRTVAFCEIEPFPRRVLKKHWPDVPIYEDVRTLTADALRRDGIAVDAICGGFPCQDISLAGAGAGIDGKRSGLWREYARLVRELRPRFIVVENVAALLARGMGVVLGALSDLGYDAIWRRIAAADVGAPHLRQRIWIVAYARGEQHEGFGDALWRAIAAELARSSSDSISDELRDESRWVSRPCGSGEAEPGNDGSPRHVADADCGGWQARRDGPSPMGYRRTASTGGCDGRTGALAYADVSGLEVEFHGNAGQRQTFIGSGWQWSSEPDVGRVAHGVPSRVDRLKGLGNAVIPQIPELIGRAIGAAMAAA